MREVTSKVIVFLSLVLTVLAFVLVLHPLFRRKSPRAGDESVVGEELQGLYFKRDTLYAAIKELEFDREMGSLSREDYESLAHRYKAEAVSILKEIDRAAEEEPLEDEIERQILELRRARAQAATPELVCPVCGTGYSLKDKFCPSCGIPLPVCPHCGAPPREGDLFCSQCGASLPQREAP